jgi:hypothetical protein
MKDSTQRIAVYSGVVLAVSWAAAGFFYLLGGRLGGLVGTGFAMSYMFIPAAVGAGLGHWRDGANVFTKLGLESDERSRSWAWWGAAALFPMICVSLAVAASVLVPGATVGLSADFMVATLQETLPPAQAEQARQQLEALPVHPVFLLIVPSLIAGPTINAVFALGEEMGWRGYLYDEARDWGFWGYSAGIGVVWGIWHAPLILMGHNYPEHSVAGVGMMVAFTVLWSPLHTLIRDKVGMSLGPAVLHGTINATAGIPMLLVAGGSDLTVGVTGAAGLGALAVVNAVLWSSGVWRRPTD